MPQTQKGRNAILIEELKYGIFRETPIRVLKITDGLFPVKFEYKQRGFKGLVFSEKLHKIKFV